MNHPNYMSPPRNVRSRRRRTSAAVPFLLVIAAVLLIAAVILAVCLAKVSRESDSLRSGENAENAALSAELAASTRRVGDLEAEISALSGQMSEMEAQRKMLIDAAGGDEDLLTAFSEEIARLQSELNDRESEIALLQSSISKLGSACTVDINRQFDLIMQLEALLSDPPELTKNVLTVNDDGSETTETVAWKPTISLYYEDIENGYTYSFNGDAVYDSASCIKAPFALSLCLGAEEELAALPVGADPLAYNLYYNFTVNTLTYDAATMKENGTGKIKDGADGAVYTHQQLIEYMMQYSDCVAYNQLKAAYGTDRLRTLVSTLGLTSMKKSMSNMSAEDGGKVMRAIYDYVKSGGVYSNMLYNAMVNSAHTVMIGYAVSPSATIHKYGWDTGAYHDMAVVLDKHPYILVVMTDMDCGGDTVNEYIRSAVTLVNQMHMNFYAD